ncbi:hypothetical protein SLS62_001402 [Diatrype stigma]|uniref:Uncharacterized protein n=1 Tax=Diatrype stigma TaxID=117547 RepID=A0AAN9V1W5_9PEZI
MVNSSPRMYAALSSHPATHLSSSLNKVAATKSPRLMPAAVTVLAVSSVAYYVQRQLMRESKDFDSFFATKHNLAESILQEDNKRILHEVNEGQKNLLNILGK